MQAHLLNYGRSQRDGTRLARFRLLETNARFRLLGRLNYGQLPLVQVWANIARAEVVIGYAVGGGLEYAFGPNARLRMEYLYYGFPGKTVTSETTSSNFCGACSPPFQFNTSTSTASMSVRPSMNVVRAGVDWRFN